MRLEKTVSEYKVEVIITLLMAFVSTLFKVLLRVFI